MTEKKLQQETANQAKQLLPDNREYFEKLMVFTRLRSWFKDKQQVELQLQAILSDMLDAQAGGVSAADYFGPDPAAYARAILKALPTNRSTVVHAVSFVGGFYLVMMLLPALLTPNEPVDLGRLLLELVPLALFGIGFAWAISKLVYLKGKRAAVMGAVVGGGAAIVVSVVFCFVFTVSTSWQVRLIGPWSIALIVSLMLATLAIFVANRRHASNLLVDSLYLSVLEVIGVVGLLARFKATAAWINDDTIIWLLIGAWAVLMLGLFGTLGFALIKNIRAQRKEKG